jgi:hypothetical protein
MPAFVKHASIESCKQLCWWACMLKYIHAWHPGEVVWQWPRHWIGPPAGCQPEGLDPRGVRGGSFHSGVSFYFNYFISKLWCCIRKLFSRMSHPRILNYRCFKYGSNFPTPPSCIVSEVLLESDFLLSPQMEHILSMDGISSGQNSSPVKHFITHCHFRECNTLQK